MEARAAARLRQAASGAPAAGGRGGRGQARSGNGNRSAYQRSGGRRGGRGPRTPPVLGLLGPGSPGGALNQRFEKRRRRLGASKNRRLSFLRRARASICDQVAGIAENASGRLAHDQVSRERDGFELADTALQTKYKPLGG